ncbi:DUF692 domain-containing protein [Streptomyces sp. KL110A]|uniref:DUF692 domain-containing protein n=1 Tax=Streptomyces sp. KL110A TaxID=3384221 RepID=UPI0038C69D47
MTELGIGIGWRPEIADAVEELPGIDWVEVVAENVCAGHLPDSLARLRARGVTVVPHGVSLGLGGADRPDPERLAALAEKAEALGAPLVTEHIAFVRAGGPLTASPRLEAGHLLPVPRTRDALDVLCENVRIAQESLPVPLALENIAALFSWPGEELSEGRFLAELVERTGVRLLIDVANLHTNHRNRGEDPARALAELPVEAIAYVHVAGGVERDGVWHDTHAHPVPAPVLDILADLAGRVAPPGVLLERDDRFPPAAELAAELTAIRATVTTARRRPAPAAAPHDRPASRHGVGAAALRAGRALAGGDPLLIGAGARVSGGLMPAVGAVRPPGPRPRPHRRRGKGARRWPRRRARPRCPPGTRHGREWGWGRWRCCRHWSRGLRCPRASTCGGCGCRAGRSRGSGPRSWRGSRPSSRRSSARGSGPRSWRTPGPGRCRGATGGTRWTSSSRCSWTSGPSGGS